MLAYPSRGAVLFCTVSAETALLDWRLA